MHNDGKNNNGKQSRKIGLNKLTMRKLNDGELSQVAGGGFQSSDVGCKSCSTSGVRVGYNCPTSQIECVEY